MTNKDRLIQQISDMGDKYGNKLIQFLNEYGLVSLLEATEEQLQEFINKELKK